MCHFNGSVCMCNANFTVIYFNDLFVLEASFDIYSVGLAVHPVSGKVFCTNFTNGNITVLNADLILSHSFDGVMGYFQPHKVWQ